MWKVEEGTYLPPGETPTDHTRLGRQEWNDRLGDAVNRVRVANLMAFAALGVAALAVFGYYRKQEHFLPPIVVVKDRLGDVVATVRPSYGVPPDDAAIAADLKRWVWNARSIFTDANALKAGILAAYGPLRAGSQAVEQLNRFYTAEPKDEPFARAQHESVIISDETALPVDAASNGGLRTFRIEWKEDTIGRDGASLGSKAWEANITFEWQPPKEDEVSKAPDGIWITSFRWTQR
jgi:type IV secretory pathway TrbF-like protein